MGILYNVPDLKTWGFMAFVLLALIAFNELGRTKKWGGILLFVIVPLVLTIAIWPTTAAPGNEYGTGNWFNWVKTYSALAGCIGFMLIRFCPKIEHSKFAMYFPPIILAANICEAVMRDFQVFSWGLTEGGYVDNLWTISGPWNVMNGIAGLINIFCMTGWWAVYSSKDKKDMIWPDMIWVYILVYDVWNFAYTYNCLPTHSWFCGVALLLAPTIAALCWNKGGWIMNRANTLCVWCMFAQVFPLFQETMSDGTQIYPWATLTKQYADGTLNGIAAGTSVNADPTAMTIVSATALIVNVIALAYIIYKSVKTKTNPYKGEIFTDFRYYKAAADRSNM